MAPTACELVYAVAPDGSSRNHVPMSAAKRRLYVAAITPAARAVLHKETSLIRPSKGAFSNRSLPISSGLVFAEIRSGMPYGMPFASLAWSDRVYLALPLRYTVTVCPLLTNVICVQRFGRSTSWVSNQIPRVPVRVESS